RSYYVPIIAVLLVAATILLMWFGYRAISEWQRSTREVVNRRTVEVLYLAVTALIRDMRSVQSQVLFQLNPATNDAEMYELSDEIAKAFARFPYPDSFFSWTGNAQGKGELHVFNRADRPPDWHKAGIPTTDFPMTLLKNPEEFSNTIHQLREQASLRTRFIVFETELDGEPYHVVERAAYLHAS